MTVEDQGSTTTSPADETLVPDASNSSLRHSASLRFGSDSSGGDHDPLKRFEALAHSAAMDKETALSMMALQHEMETHHMRDIHAMERKLDTPRHEVTTPEQSRRFGEMIQELSGELSTLRQHLQGLENKLADIVPQRKR